ncbi:type II secretion system protein [bacterium]|nr:type II secretion system protein [bacterium]
MKYRGFTLIEMLVVILIIGILVAIAVPNFTRIKDKAREAEVKANLHNIQLALERYATDNQGVFPPWLYGGDFTDSWVADQRTWDKLTAGSGVEIGGETTTSVPGWVEVAGAGDGDALVMGGYIRNYTYPENPFFARANRDTVDDPLANPVSQRSDSSTSNRDVGGRTNTIMWEISGGPPKNGDPTPNGHPGWKYLFPVQKHNPTTNEITPSGTVEHAPLMIGNFYYYSINRNNKSWGDYDPNWVDTTVDASLREPPIWVDGFILVGYGSLQNDGQDIYDVYGEFKHHCRTADAGGGPNQPINSGTGGPDGIPDGAILVISSDKSIESAEMNN